MKFEIELSRIAFKNMSKIPKKDLIRLHNKIERLILDPKPEDSKKDSGGRQPLQD